MLTIKKSEKRLMKNKGLSSVFITILIVSLIIAMIPVLYILIEKLIKSPLYSPEFECASFQINPSVNIKNICYNSSSHDIQITLERVSENPRINLIEFIASFGNTPEIYECGGDCGHCVILKPGSKTYYIHSEIKPSVLAIQINKCILETREVNQCS